MSQDKTAVQANINNMDAVHSTVEMFLSSLYLDDFTSEEQILIASNKTIKYVYKKGPHGNIMTVQLLSLEQMELPLMVVFGSEPFPMRKIEYPGVLDTRRL
jgi:hypothetical protein